MHYRGGLQCLCAIIYLEARGDGCFREVPDFTVTPLSGSTVWLCEARVLVYLNHFLSPFAKPPVMV